MFTPPSQTNAEAPDYDFGYDAEKEARRQGHDEDLAIVLETQHRFRAER